MKVRLIIPALAKRSCERQYSDERLENLALNLLPAEEAEAIEKHSRSCSRCAEELASIRRRAVLIRSILGEETGPVLAPVHIPPARLSPALAKVKASFRPAWIPAPISFGGDSGSPANRVGIWVSCAASVLVLASIGIDRTPEGLRQPLQTGMKIASYSLEPAPIPAEVGHQLDATEPAPAPRRRLPARDRMSDFVQTEPAQFLPPEPSTPSSLPPTVVLASVAPPPVPPPKTIRASNLVLHADFPDVAPPKPNFFRRLGSAVWPFHKHHGGNEVQSAEIRETSRDAT